MYLFIDAALLFVALFLLLLLFADKINVKSLLKIKLLIFVFVFLFHMVAELIYHPSNKDFKTVFRKGFFIASFAVIGYSVYLDLFMMPDTRELMNRKMNSNFARSVFISGIISAFTLGLGAIESLTR